MKKLVYLIVLILVTSGCSNKSGVLTCTSNITPQEDLTVKSEYIVIYKNNYVKKLKTKEIITVKNKEDLKKYEEVLKNSYKEYNKITYYSNNISIEDNNLISSTVINYEKIDTDKLIEIDSSNKSLIKDKKISLKDIKKMYQENGCICK